MAATQLVKIVVQELTKYGFKAEGRYINYSKQLSEKDKQLVVPGASLEAEFYVADSGKEYLNKVLNVLNKTTPKAESKKVTAEATFAPLKAVLPKASDNGMSKEEWFLKDRRISRQGLIQACILAVAPLVSMEMVFEEAVKLADKALEYVNRAA